MKAFVIAIVGLPCSERGATSCIERARQYDLEVELFPATTRYEATAVLRAEGLTIDERIYDRISDEPIGDRGKLETGRRHLTAPEVGCFLSHYRLWRRCVERGEPIIVFEHDVLLIAPPPSLIPTILALSFHISADAGAGGYIISPAGAGALLDTARNKGIQPADEILWKSALGPRQRAFCRPPVIAYEDSGISTIQFTRSDPQHDRIRKFDPWVDFVAPQG